MSNTEAHTPHGTTCFVYGRVHPALNTYPLLIDSGAGISLIPKRWYDSIPVEKRPKLKATTLNVRTGNKVKINVAGIMKTVLRLQCGDYPCQFHVSPDEIHGILGMDFLEKHRVNFSAADKKLFVGNRPVKVYNQMGSCLNHRIISAETVYAPPHQRFIIPGQVEGCGEIEAHDVIMESDQSLFANLGILAPRVLVVPRYNQVPVEIVNMTDEHRTIPSGALLGIIAGVEEMRSHWDDPALGVSSCADQPADDAIVTGNSDDKLADGAEVVVNTVSVTEVGADLPEQAVPLHLQALYEQYAAGLDDDERAAFAVLLCEYADVFAKHKTDLGRTSWVKHHIDTGDAKPFKHRPYRLPQMKYDEMKKQVLTLAEKGIIRPSTSNWASNVLLVKKKDNTWRMCIDYRELNRKTQNVDPYLMPRIDDTLDQLGKAKYFCTLDLISGYHQVELTEESKPKTAFTTPRMNPSQWEYNCMPFGVQGGPATFQRLMDKLLCGLDYRVALAYLDDIIIYGASHMECIQRLAIVFQRLRSAGLKLKPSKCSLFESETLYLGHIVSAQGVKCDPAKVSAVAEWRPPTNYKQVQVFLGTVNYYNRFIKDFSKIAYPLRRAARDKKSFVWTDECEKAFETLKASLVSAPIMAYPLEEGLYILDTDASAFAIGAVLSQRQPDDNGTELERVIAYGSRTLEGREQRYCTRRRELLAIVHFVKHFKPYLWGREVLIRTDHASLKYIKTQNNPDDQFARWVERLEEIRYTIEIRKGVKHCNADGLSRLESEQCAGKRCICPGVAALEATGDTQDDYKYTGNIDWPVIQERRMSAAHMRERCDACCAFSGHTGEHSDTDDDSDDNSVQVNAFAFTSDWIADELAVAQEADTDVGPVYTAKAASRIKPHPSTYSGESAETKTYMHDWDRLVIKANGVLYRRWESDDGVEVKYQIILPAPYRDDLYKHLHESKIGCHMGRRRTLHRMQKRYYWYRMAEDIKLWIKACDICQLRKRANQSARAPLTVFTSGMPNERVALDVLGPLARSKKGNKVILVMTDHFSKYTKAIAMPNQEAKTVAAVFDREWVSVFGAPRNVHTDQGSNFEAHTFREMCRLLQIEKSRTTAYHPQGNSQAERFNSTLLNMIHAHARDNPKEWDENLHHVVLFYNSTKHSSTDVEPNRVMFGRNVDLPIDITMPADPSIQPQTPNDYVRQLEKKLRAAYMSTRAHLKRAATAQKKYYDRSSHLYKYKEGDMVKLRRFVRKPGIGKYADRYEGPFFILDILGDVTFRIIKCPESRAKVVHHDHILPYFPKEASENVDKTWVLKLSKTYKPTNKTDAVCQTSGRTDAGQDASGSSSEVLDQEITPTTELGQQLRLAESESESEQMFLADSDSDDQEIHTSDQRVIASSHCQEQVDAVNNPDAPAIQQKKRGRPRKVKADESLDTFHAAKVPRVDVTE